MTGKNITITELEALKNNFKASCMNLTASVEALHEAMKKNKVKHMQDIVIQQKNDLENFNFSKRLLEKIDPSGHIIKDLSAEALMEVEELRKKNRINRQMAKSSLATTNRVFRKTRRSVEPGDFSYAKSGKLGNQKKTSYFINRIG
jgi:CRISPR/Cas system CSM-associated protein Csm3 (group 7 of RAMP superfamily)